MCCDPSSPGALHWPSGLSEWMMAGLVSVTAIVLLQAAFLVIPRLMRFGARLTEESRISRLVIAARAGLTQDDAFELSDGISRLGNQKSKGCILLRDLSAKSAGSFSAVLPDAIPDFPWSGKLVRAEYLGRGRGCPVSFKVEDPPASAERIALHPKVFRPPRVKAATGKAQHVFSTDRYLQMSGDLRARMNALCPEAPLRLLEAVLRNQGIGEDAIRVGLSPQWVQGWRTHKCPECGRPMRLVIQLPGDAIDRKVAEGVFYLFGCASHPEVTVTDDDWH